LIHAIIEIQIHTKTGHIRLNTHTKLHKHTISTTIRHTNLVHKFGHSHLDTHNYTPTFRHINPKQIQTNTI